MFISLFLFFSHLLFFFFSRLFLFCTRVEQNTAALDEAKPVFTRLPLHHPPIQRTLSRLRYPHHRHPLFRLLSTTSLISPTTSVLPHSQDTTIPVTFDVCYEDVSHTMALLFISYISIYTNLLASSWLFLFHSFTLVFLSHASSSSWESICFLVRVVARTKNRNSACAFVYLPSAVFRLFGIGLAWVGALALNSGFWFLRILDYSSLIIGFDYCTALDRGHSTAQTMQKGLLCHSLQCPCRPRLG